jgi:hypothetical protein
MIILILICRKNIYKEIFYFSNDKMFYYPPLAGEVVRSLDSFKLGWIKSSIELLVYKSATQ